MGVQTAGYIVIGNEILSGKVQDLNTLFLARTLRELGVRLVRVTIVEDVPEAIALVVREESQRVDHLFTSGGVGPTHDDVTMRSIADAFGVGLVRHERFAAEIARHYGDRTNDAVLSMADLPEGAELIPGEGLFIPVVRLGNVYILPGVPELFARKVRALAERFRSSPYHLRKLFLELDEGEIAGALGQVSDRFPGVEIGSYPRYDEGAGYRVLVTVESKDAQAVERAREALLASLPAEAVLRQE